MRPCSPPQTDAADAPAVALRNARVRFDGAAAPALDIDSLTIDGGERVAIIGSSGAGKTTLVRLINGLVLPTDGTITVLGHDTRHLAFRRREHRRRIGCIFQEFNLVERATIFRNVLCGRLGWTHPAASFLGRFSETDKTLAMAVIEETGLGELAHRRVDTLSGGQRQRVAIARVLAQEPEIVTADEPVSNLDPVLSAEMLDLLAAAAERRRATLVTIVHRPELAQRRVDRILGLRHGRLIFDSASGAFLDARALREIYGGNVPLTAVPGEEPLRSPDADGALSPIHVA